MNELSLPIHAMADDITTRVGWDNTDVVAGAAEYERIARRSAERVEKELDGSKGLEKAFERAQGALMWTAGVVGVSELLDDMGRVKDLADQLMQSPEAIQRMGAQAKLSGSDMEAVASGLNKINKELAAGKGVEVFSRLSVGVQEYLSLDADQQFVLLAEAFQAAQEDGRGLGEMYELFGKSAKELLPLLRTGADELREIAKIQVVSEEQINRLAEFGDKIDGLLIRTKAGFASFALDSIDMAHAFGGAWAEGFRDARGELDLMAMAMGALKLTPLGMNLAASGLGAGAGGGQGESMEERFRKRVQAQKAMAAQEKAEADAERERARRAQADAADRAAREQAVGEEIKDLMESMEKAWEEVSRLQSVVADERQRTAEAGMTDEERRVSLIREQARLAEEIGRARAGAQGGAADALRLELELEKVKQRTLDVERKIGAERQRQDQELVRRMMREQEMRQQKAQGLGDVMAELELLQAQAAGQERKAEALEREIRIKREARALQEQLRISEEKALEIARQKVRLEDEVSGKQGGRRGRIQGYSQSQASFAESRNPFRNLEAWDKMKGRSVLQDHVRTPELDRFFAQPRGGAAKLIGAQNARIAQNPAAAHQGRLETLLDELKQEVVRLGGG